MEYSDGWIDDEDTGRGLMEEEIEEAFITFSQIR